MNKTLDWLSSYYSDVSASRQKVIDYVTNASHGVCKELKMLYLYVTFDCNQQCQYCWLHDNIETKYLKMPVHMIEKTLDEAIRLGLKKVKITGGEPFINIHLSQIINAVLIRGLNLDIETNGTLITQDWIDNLLDKEKVFLKISLDAASSYIHDNLADAEVFQKTIEGTKLLVKNSIRFGMVTVLNQLNVDQFEEIVNFVAQLGAYTHRIILSIQPLGRGKNVDDLRLDISQTLDIINRFYSLKEYHDKIEIGALHSTIPPAFMPLDSLNFNACNWGIGLCGIMPDGSVTLCSPAFEEMELIAGNLYEKSLSDIWFNSDLFSEKFVYPELDGVCGKCLFKNYCRGMCRVFAKATYGSNKAPYPFCQEMYNAGLFPEWALK